MAQQTAVDWLVKEFNLEAYEATVRLAKQKEKEQIENAYNQDLYGGLTGKKKFDNGEQYYNEIYGK